MYTIDQLKVMSGAEILALTYPQMFPANFAGVLHIARALQSLWHPDRNLTDVSLANDVSAHINALKLKADEALEAGVWGNSFSRTVETAASTLFFKYSGQENLPGYGVQYFNKTRTFFEVAPGNDDLMEILENNLVWLKNSLTPAMAKVYHLRTACDLSWGERKLVSDGKATGGRLVYFTTAGFISLKAILDKRGPLDPVHFAWIMTRLHDLCCMMQISGVPNLNISTSSILINPTEHSVMLVDGWQYAKGFAQKAVALPGRTSRLCPGLAAGKAVAMRHMMALVKAVGRECLGDPSGVKLLADKSLPQGLAKWLADGCPDDAIKALDVWKKVRNEAFGPSKFVPLNLKYEDIYPD